jgi:hypothetical protein
MLKKRFATVGGITAQLGLIIKISAKTKRIRIL